MSDTNSTQLGSPDSLHPDQWTAQQVARWLGTLSPASVAKTYSSKFKDNDIVGEVLIQLDPEALKDIGVASVGHRLLILKAVYELKMRWGIELGPEDWRPMHQDGMGNSNGDNSGAAAAAMSSTRSMASISAVAMLRALQERDERVRALELELARLEDWLVRWTGEAGNVSKVDPLQPYFPPSKAYSSLPDGMHPLDEYQHGTQALGISSDRIPLTAFSGPMTAINSAEGHRTSNTTDESLTFVGTSKNALATPASATLNNSHDDSSAHHTSGSMSQMEMSPTSSTATPSATPTSAHPPISLQSNLAAEASAISRMASPTTVGPSSSLSTTMQGNAAIAAAAAAASSSSSSAGNNVSQRSALSGGASSSVDDRTDVSTAAGSDTPYKSFRVTLDDPCHKVLPAALKKYKINDDWRQYALFICYGTTERCLSYDEKPLLLFQKLKEAKQSPVFMLRHIRDVKSPIAIASAKAAARKSASGTASTESDKIKASTSGSSMSGLTKGANAKGGTSSSKRNDAEESYVDSPPGQPVLSGPAAHLDNSKATTSGADTFAIAIYPYVSEREDELDVSVGDTFIVKSKAKGWWIVQRDAKASGQADVVGLVKAADGSAKNGGEIRSGWVPAGCLLETKQPLSYILPPLSSRPYSPKTPSEGTFSYQQQRAPASPGGTLDEDANTPKPSSLSNFMAKAPIPPSLITSTSTPGILLMDFHSPEENIHLQKDARLRVFKRYNHWSYCVEEGSRHARAWLPSWYIGKVSSSRSAAGAASTPTASTNGATPSFSTLRGGGVVAKTETLPVA